MTTKKEIMRQLHQENALLSLGFTTEEAQRLRRISRTLHRWHELECGIAGGNVERDDTGRAYWRSEKTGKLSPFPDRETAALGRLRDTLHTRNKRHQDGPQMAAYIQTDPRGAALYILRPGDVPEGKDPSAYYNQGICIC